MADGCSGRGEESSFCYIVEFVFLVLNLYVGGNQEEVACFKVLNVACVCLNMLSEEWKGNIKIMEKG